MGVDRIRRLSVPRRLEASGALVYGLVFALLLLYGRPGLGLGQGFYLAIVLVALASGPWTGGAAGLLASVLYAAALMLANRVSWAHLWRGSIEVHLVSYVVAGAAVGYFAQRARQMLGESLGVLDELLGLARRDVATGALTTDGIAGRVAERAERQWPFALLVGDLETPSDGALRAAMHTIAAVLAGDDDVARVGGRLAVLVAATSAEEAQARAAELERALEEGGCRATFGWAFHPWDGADALALFGAASERLQARRHALGEWQPSVVTELRARSASASGSA